MTTQATPRPWHAKPTHNPYGEWWIGWNGQETSIACVNNAVAGMMETEAKANARLIVRAVNAHDALLAACEAFLAAKPQCDCSDESGCSLAAARKQAREGIALAKAEQTP